MKNDRREGQFTIEYLLVLTVVIIVVIWLLRPQGIFWQDVNQGLDISFNQMEKIAQNITF